ncbi:low molecular weight protein arginine phosphatase [Clostridium paraputrificum]|uniref:low molecular weight protein arginine phosphatase n=1 Tax=Clostridium TaxID=1485 RepID=UPI003D325F97
MKILFVCTGNTCRSPIAEAIFNRLNENKKFTVKSAGISIVPGSIATKSSVELVNRELSFDINNREAVQIRKSHLEESNLVLTMTEYSRDFIKEYYPNYKNKTFTLSEYVGVKDEIIDPYGSTISIYEKTYKQIEGLVSLLLSKIKKEESS